MINGIAAIDKKDGTGHILELKYMLDFTKDMKHSIIVRMQVKQIAIILNDVQNILCPYRKSTIFLFFRRKVSTPIEFNGPISFVCVHFPTTIDFMAEGISIKTVVREVLVHLFD